MLNKYKLGAALYFYQTHLTLLPCAAYPHSDVLSQVTLTVSPESTVAQLNAVPWWIILVAVLAGILILALLVFLLWKVSTGPCFQGGLGLNNGSVFTMCLLLFIRG